MLNTFQLSQLVDPVVCRAQVATTTIRPDFVDRAARYVLERLGCDVPGKNAAWNPSIGQVCRWQWIDQQANRFFRVAPMGLGIEVDGGLSTRFHRVSDQLDWPRFAWRTVNTSDVVDCLDYVFPQLDNYSNIGCEQPAFDWIRYVPWHDPTPKMVFLGDQNPFAKWEDFVRVSVDIQSRLSNETPVLELVLTHCIPRLDEKILAAFSNIKLVDSMPTPKSKSWFSLLVQHLTDVFSNYSKAEEVYVHHIVFRRPTTLEGMI